LTSTTTTVELGSVYAYHLTAYNTAGLESDPSNEIRFQLLLASPNTTNNFTLTGFTNWQSAVLTEYPTNGTLTGTPPDLVYIKTNPLAIKDGFVYSIERRPIVSPRSTFVFQPVDDAYLQGGIRFNDNYLKVETTNRVSYLKFNVSGLTGVIENVTLKLQEAGDVGSGTFRVFHGSHNNWTETTLTTLNAPETTTQLSTFTGNISSTNIIDFNINSSVTGNGIYSFVVKQDVGGNDVWFGSDESANKPKLVIETLNPVVVEQPVTNYFSIYYLNPNTPPVITDIEVLRF
jgi:hypothetical protein